jgi:hypothetical protein
MFRAVTALLTAFALAAAAPLGKKLSTWPERPLRATESFAAGASLAYVLVDLMIELTGNGAAYVHARAPIGPSEERSLFAVVLLGATWWYLVGALAEKKGQSRMRYWAYVVPQAIYCLLVGGALALEADFGALPLALFSLPLLLHLTVIESQLLSNFEREHVGLRRAVLAVMPGLGAIAWAIIGFSHTTLFFALALVAGSTVVQIIQRELPSPASVQVWPFLGGVGMYSAMIAMRWASGE